MRKETYIIFSRMKKIIASSVILLFLSLSPNYLIGQSLANFSAAMQKNVYVPSLQDTVQLEIRVPLQMQLTTNVSSPVFFLFDSQNTINYTYNLQTIDYLCSFGNIPAPLLIGVSFPGAVRNKWTTPVAEKGKADSLLYFLLITLKKELAKQYTLADFTVLIGHSRTAMLSCFAISKFPSSVNAIIAASNSFFDFDSKYQQKLFEEYIAAKKLNNKQKHYYYFSGGTIANGDQHNNSINKLNNYFKKQKFPSSFSWRYYAEPTGHFTTPGLTVGRALNDIFNPYTAAINRALKIVNNQKYNDSVPLNQYAKAYTEASKQSGLLLQPDLTFYNSIASAYLNDYNEVFKEKKNKLAAVVLKEAIKHYPGYASFYSMLAEISIEENRIIDARQLLNQAKEKVNLLNYYNGTLRQEELAYINELEKMLEKQ